MILFVLSGNIILIFPENMILLFRQKMKDYIFQKIREDLKFCSNILKKWSFYKNLSVV